MTRPARSALLLPLAFALAACDVQIRDATPEAYPANHELGIYEVRAYVEPGALVSPTSLFVRAHIDGAIVALERSAEDETLWTGLHSVRCQPGFPLQLHGIWTVQGLATRRKAVPAEPRVVRLIEPEPLLEVAVDTSKKNADGWQAVIPFRFVTNPLTRITAARIEPESEALSVITELPLEAPCGEPVEIRVRSSEPRAQGTLVVETDHPALSRQEIAVSFVPLEQGGS